MAAVFTPQEHTFLPRWGEDAGQLCIKINRHSLENELEAMIGRPVTSWVRFSLGFDLTGPAGRSWLSLVRLGAVPGPASHPGPSPPAATAAAAPSGVAQPDRAWWTSSWLPRSTSGTARQA